MDPSSLQEGATVESGPLWGLLLVLAEIAERVARQAGSEQESPDDVGGRTPAA